MTLHLEGEEVSVFSKHKQDTIFGDKRDSHKPGKISISRPCVQSRSARLKNSLPIVITPHFPTTKDGKQLQLSTYNAPQQVDQYHVTAIKKIAHMPKTSTKASFALQAITKKKCIAWIVQDGKSTAAPTYSDLIKNYPNQKVNPIGFSFCSNNIQRCVEGTKRNWVVLVLNVLKIWPVKFGTNLTCKKIFSLERQALDCPSGRR